MLSSGAHEPQLLSLHGATTEAREPWTRALQQEKPSQYETGAAPRRAIPAHPNWRKSEQAGKTQHSQKWINILKRLEL